MEGPVEFLEGYGVVPKLQKTKDIIDAKMDGARHREGPFPGAKAEFASF
jgi:hypothetical protein